jgi:hypothetical protein
MPKVLNLRTASVDELKAAARIDRQTRWGNRHRIGYCWNCRTSHDRIGAVSAYIKDLRNNPQLVEAIRKNLSGLDVACWCAPDLCHGQIIIEVANGSPEWLRSPQ